MSSEHLKKALQATPIVVTGMGAWTPGGASVPGLWESLLAGRSPALWQDMPPGLPSAQVPVCPAQTPGNLHPALRRMARMDRSVALGAAAAMEAWDQAGLTGHAISPHRVGIIVGTSRGPVHALADVVENLREGRAYPSASAHANPAALSGTLAAMLGVCGPCFVVSAACASSAVAVATAAQLLLSGAVDVVLAGGAEAPLHPSTLAVLDAAGILARSDEPKTACRPFDTRRSGTVLGEGAAFLVLETHEHAMRRGGALHGRLAGWGITCEPGERTGIRDDGDGLASAMREALGMAGLAPGDVGYLNPHGTATLLNDREEARSIRTVFAAGQPLISATKAVTGHCMGASAAIEAVIALLVLKEKTVPPTANCDLVDQGLGLHPVVKEAAGTNASVVMSNSSGFWGNHASLVFTRA